MRTKLSWLIIMVLIAGTISCSGIKPPRGAVKSEKNMLITGYCSCKKCSGWRRTMFFKKVYSGGKNKGKKKKIGITASGVKARKGTVAADGKLYPFGTVMYIPGYGYGKVEDRGGAIKGQHIDLYFKSHKAALRWGRQNKRVKIWIPRK